VNRLRSARSRIVTALGAIAALCATVGVPDAAHATITGNCFDQTPVTGQGFTMKACFTWPTYSGTTVTPDRSITDELAAVIGTAAAGDTVDAAFYRLSYSTVVNALIAASTAQATVNVLVDKDSLDSPAGTQAVTDLRAGGVKVTVCYDQSTSPLPSGGGHCLIANNSSIMHNKFVVVQRATDPIVVQTSMNQHGNQDSKIQSAMEVQNSPTLASQYVEYFNDLASNKWTTVALQSTHIQPWASPTAPKVDITSFTPKGTGTGSSDDLADIVNSVDCSNADHHTLYVANPLFNGRDALRQALVNALNDGCIVKVAVATCADEKYVETSPVAGGGHLYHPDVVRSVTPVASGISEDFASHDKLILVDARLRNASGTYSVRHAIFSSTQDFSDGFYKYGGNATLGYDDAHSSDASSLWGLYMQHWSHIMAHATAQSASPVDDDCP
jgi:hypothetical protein